MEVLDFSRLAWRSANSYYNYLQNSKHGRNVINIDSIHQISGNKFTLHLSKKVAYIDSAEIKINSDTCPFDIGEDDIQIVEYNELSAYITIVTSNRLSQILITTPAYDITLESDLTFLVKAVRDWYHKYHERIAFPPLPSSAYETPQRPNHASNEQYEAIHTAMSSPISYIWGAPGTGKTQMVLANCILNYAENGEQVLLMAPTNNALEQSLSGIISVLDEKHIDRNRIIRLGKATSDFLTKYPEVCEAGYYDSLVDSLKAELDHLKEIYKKQKDFESFSAIYKDYKNASEQYEITLENKKRYDDELFALQSAISDLLSDINEIKSKKASTTVLLNNLQTQKKRQDHYYLLIKNHPLFCSIADRYFANIDKYTKRILRLRNDYSISINRINEIKHEISKENVALDSDIQKSHSLSFRIKSFFSSETKRNMECAISQRRNHIESLKASLKTEEATLNQISTDIKIAESKLSKAHQIIIGNKDLLDMSQALFGKPLSFDDLKLSFEKDMVEYAKFNPDEEIDATIKETQSRLCVFINQIDEKEILYKEKEQKAKEISTLVMNHMNNARNLRLRLSKLSISMFDKDIALDKLNEKFTELSQQYGDIVEIPNIEQQILDKEQEYQNIMVQLKDVLKVRTIIACTVDYATIHYDKFAEGIVGNAVHLFVDEAAYCSLIRAGVFFSFGIPVTLFGDHMQLPPICEMDKQAILSNEDNHNIFLWDMSSIHFPDIFENSVSLDSMMNGYSINSSPIFNNVNVSFLKKTFRFGENLATILDKFVYKQGFCGNVEATTEISIIDASRYHHKSAWNESPSEINAIKIYLKEFAPKDFAILTPYKNQRNLIEKELHLPAEKVLTIHSAQGREWDTVIISVVDANRKFFMSSKNEKSNGLRIVNTAISRAKKKLVLVLDYNCWRYCHDELISTIVNNYI